MTVSELTRRVAHIIDADPELHDVSVRGELSNYTAHRSGHWYFTLKDKDSELLCVMFRGSNARVRFSPKVGDRVVARGQVTVYQPRGRYQLLVSQLEPDGVGALYEALERLKAKLRAEGLFDKDRKRPLPPVPRRVAVVTSATGAAVRDIIARSRARDPGVRLVVVPATVQGEGAAASVQDAMQRALAIPEVDVVIVGRGGGSMEDLWAFNDEALARTVAGYPLPVVSAVGHETDVTLIDYVADVRAPTPTAAAELVVPDMRARQEQFNTVRRRLVNTMQLHLQRWRMRLDGLRSRPVLRDPLAPLNQHRQTIDELRSRADSAIHRRLDRLRQRLDAAGGRLRALNPYGVLQRGYAILQDAEGVAVSSVESVVVDQETSVLLCDGVVHGVVTAVAPGAPFEERSDE